MQRLIAHITLAAFLLVVAAPVMPVAKACAHQTMGSDKPCNMGCHTQKATLMPDDLDMGELSMDAMDAATAQPVAQIKKSSTLSQEKAPRCRIECACGCNDGTKIFPIVLTPHLPSAVQSIKIIQDQPVQTTYFAPIPYTHAPPCTPPPKLS